MKLRAVCPRRGGGGGGTEGRCGNPTPAYDSALTHAPPPDATLPHFQSSPQPHKPALLASRPGGLCARCPLSLFPVRAATKFPLASAERLNTKTSSAPGPPDGTHCRVPVADALRLPQASHRPSPIPRAPAPHLRSPPIPPSRRLRPGHFGGVRQERGPAVVRGLGPRLMPGTWALRPKRGTTSEQGTGGADCGESGAEGCSGDGPTHEGDRGCPREGGSGALLLGKRHTSVPEPPPPREAPKNTRNVPTPPPAPPAQWLMAPVV